VTPGQPLFHRLYGPALSSLPAPIHTLHDVAERKTFRGAARIEIGAGRIAQFVSRLLRFPPASEKTMLTLVMTPEGNGELWERSFGNFKMTTRLSPGKRPASVEERLWPFTAVSEIKPDSQGVIQVLTGLRCLSVALPRLLWPKMDVREGADGSRYTFSRSIRFPWNTPLILYEGWLETAVPEKIRI